MTESSANTFICDVPDYIEQAPGPDDLHAVVYGYTLEEFLQLPEDIVDGIREQAQRKSEQHLKMQQLVADDDADLAYQCEQCPNPAILNKQTRDKYGNKFRWAKAT